MVAESSAELTHVLRQAVNTLQRADLRAALSYLQRHSAEAAVAVGDPQMSLFSLLEDEQLLYRTEVLMDAAFYLTTVATYLLEHKHEVMPTINDLDDRMDELLNYAGQMLETIGRHSTTAPRSLLPHFYLHAALDYQISGYLAKSWIMARNFQGQLGEAQAAMGTPLQYYYNDVQQLVSHFLLRDLAKVEHLLDEQFRWRKGRLVAWLNEAVEGDEIGIEEISRFVASYEMAAAIGRFCHFLRTGDEQGTLDAQRLIANAIEIFTEAHLAAELRLACLLRLAMGKTAQRSIWQQLGELPNFPRAYLERLAQPRRSTERPIYELWKSQMRAVQHGIFDGHERRLPSTALPPRHFIIAMQPGAGKTLIAELEIVRFLSDDDSGLCLYVVPTRALASQAEDELGRRMGDIGLHPISLAGMGLSLVDVTRLSNARVLITTPEKLNSILARQRDDVSVWNELLSPGRVKLVVIDEAHLMGTQDTRGLLLEMLLLRLRDLYPTARIVFQSAVIKNPILISRWLNEGRKWADNSAIVVDDWAPTDLLYGVLRRDGVVEYENGVEIPVLSGSATRGATIPPVQLVLQYCLPRRLKTLVFASSQDRARQIAGLIAAELPGPESGELSPALVRLIVAVKAELAAMGVHLPVHDAAIKGRDEQTQTADEFPLISCLCKRVAFHHAGLPASVRTGIERAVRGGEIEVVVATTTLAEGLNLPVSCVVVADLSFYDPDTQKHEPISRMLLRNIAGRAGRPYEDTRGEVIIVQPASPKRQQATDTLARAKGYWIRSSTEVEPVESSLCALYKEVRSAPQTVLHGPLTRTYQAQLLAAMQEGAIDIDDPRAFVEQTLLAYDKRKRRFVETLVEHTRAQLAYIEESPSESLPAFQHTGFPAQVCRDMLQRVEARTSEDRQYYRLYQVGKEAKDDPRTVEVLQMAFLPFKFYNRVDNLGVLLDWISGDPIATIADQHFHTNGAIGYYDEVLRCSSHIERFMKLYAAWGLSGFVHLLRFWKEHKDAAVEYTSIVELLPRFAGYGVNHPVAVYLQDMGILNREDALLASRAFDVTEQLTYDATRDFFRTLDWMRNLDRGAFHHVMEDEKAESIHNTLHEYSSFRLDQTALDFYAEELAT
jgi:replicative superfamily II helicase